MSKQTNQQIKRTFVIPNELMGKSCCNMKALAGMTTVKSLVRGSSQTHMEQDLSFFCLKFPSLPLRFHTEGKALN